MECGDVLNLRDEQWTVTVDKEKLTAFPINIYINNNKLFCEWVSSESCWILIEAWEELDADSANLPISNQIVSQTTGY
jgi:hypothetical protein